MVFVLGDIYLVRGGRFYDFNRLLYDSNRLLLFYGKAFSLSQSLIFRKHSVFTFFLRIFAIFNEDTRLIANLCQGSAG